MEFIDTHCHLVSEKLFNNASDLIAAAHSAHVTRIINIAYNLETTQKGLFLAEQFENVWTTFGIQPHDASSYSPEVAHELKTMCSKNPKVVAVGEIGLDAYYTLSPIHQQIDCFRHFLQVACEVEKPVVVHVRETHQLVLDSLACFAKQNLQGVIHCFTGSIEEAKEFLDLGFYISFSGIVTFKSASDLQEVARFVPADRILIETDSPYLAPIPKRGKVNEPAFVAYTAQFLADLRNTSLDTFASQTLTNAINLFKIPCPSID